MLLLGVLWSMRLAAMKSAGQSGIPPHVVAPVSILGIAIIYSATSAMRRNRPPIGRPAIVFYGLSGLLGFVLPFILEIMVSAKLPLFSFAVIISTMPILTSILAAFLGVEHLNMKRVRSREPEQRLITPHAMFSRRYSALANGCFPTELAQSQHSC